MRVRTYTFVTLDGYVSTPDGRPIQLLLPGFPGATRDEAGRPSLTQELDLIRKEMPFFTREDREKILGRNAAKLWGFE